MIGTLLFFVAASIGGAGGAGVVYLINKSTGWATFAAGLASVAWAIFLIFAFFSADKKMSMKSDADKVCYPQQATNFTFEARSESAAFDCGKDGKLRHLGGK